MQSTTSKRVSTGVFVLSCLVATTAFAQQSPVGRWKTIDDASGEAKSIVQITENAGKLSGAIESLVLKPGEDPNPLCDKCSGTRSNKPIRGMNILWGVSKKGGQWEGGKILDPKTGKVYSVKLRPLEGGRKLEVRGYLGFSLLGRTQVWVRE